eukprot:TRINITY_DN2148_c0_g1_i2.p2 TRINITY_DN2148_c0_g1~~TRINITY_DN2148_c0_g1_i2.p2  ORF type:complete len:232 (+),score=62.40 TRINITY_DN2148_c0_g1_i2:56-751(+)
MELVYSSREQLISILEEFFSALADPAFKAELRALGDEKKITLKIEEKQKEILKLRGIDPDRGIKDLSKIRRVYSNDREVLQKLFMLATKEESATREALGENMKTSDSMDEMKNLFQNSAQMFTQLQNNPQILSQMTPEQLNQYQQLLQAISQRQTQFTPQPTPTTSPSPQQQPTIPSPVPGPAPQQAPQQTQNQGWFGGFWSALGWNTAAPAPAPPSSSTPKPMSKDDDLD